MRTTIIGTLAFIAFAAIHFAASTSPAHCEGVTSCLPTVCYSTAACSNSACICMNPGPRGQCVSFD